MIEKIPGRSTALPTDVEKSLAGHLVTMAKWGFALTRRDVMNVTKEYVEQNALAVPFKDNMPGKYWFINFCQRNKLSLKNMERLEKCRRRATSDPFIIYEFYDVLENLLKSLNIFCKPENVYNLDETSFCTDANRVKFLSGVGQKAYKQLEGTGRENTTVMACVSASGKVLPPLFIFKGNNLWTNWKGDNDIPGSFYAASENGWMTTVIFQEWFYKFCTLVKERPLLLLLDGHVTHLDMGTIQHAKDNEVTIIKLPPHTTDVLQPLDVTCFKSLKNEWNIKLTEWYRLNQRKLIRCEFANLMCTIWDKGLRPENIKSGFKTTGIFPCDRSKYPTNRFDPEKLKRYNDGERLEPLTLVETTNDQPLPQPTTSNHPTSRPTTGEQTEEAPFQSPNSFEQLLLARIKKTDAPSKSRRKIDVRVKVITSEEYAKEIEQKKKEEEEKKKKKRINKQKPNGLEDNVQVKKKKKKKTPIVEEDDDDEGLSMEDIVDDDSLKDINLFESNDDEIHEELMDAKEVKVGDFLLAQFKGGKRQSVTYRYVVSVSNVYEDGELYVNAMVSDGNKKTFKDIDDLSTITTSDVVGKLPMPDISMVGGRPRFIFKNEVDVFEMKSYRD